MIFSSSAKDFWYEAQTSALTYYIEVDGSPIYWGKAVSTTGNARINVGRRVSDYLETDMPDFRNYNGVIVPHPKQMRVFNLRDNNGVLIGSYTVLLDADGSWTGQYGPITSPVNGHTDPRQKIFWTTVEEIPENIIITGTTGNTDGCCQNVPQPSVELPYETSFSTSKMTDLEDGVYSEISEIISFSTDEEAQASGYPSAGYYLLNYSGSPRSSSWNATDGWYRDYVLPAKVMDGGTLETDISGGLVVSYNNNYIKNIVAPYADYLVIIGSLGTNAVSGINADNAEYVRIRAARGEYPTVFTNLKHLCFYNALEVEIDGGKASFSDVLGPYSDSSGKTDSTPVLETIDLPNAEIARISATRSTSFRGFTAPKLKTGRLRFGGTSITGISLPSFEREFVPTGSPQEGFWDGYAPCDFSFINCTGLTEVYFGPEYKGAWGSFYGCTGLESFSNSHINAIQMQAEFSYTGCKDSGGAGTFERCSSLRDISLPSLQYAGPRSFAKCTALTAVTFPELERLDALAFYGCSGLTGINIPKLKSISVYGVFADCKSLTSITLNCDTMFGYTGNGCGYMFEGCTHLLSVSLPNMKSFEVGGGMFGYGNILNSSVTSITLGSLEWWGTIDSNTHSYFNLPSSLTDLYLPSTLRKIYGWDGFNAEGPNVTPTFIDIHYDGTKAQWNYIIRNTSGYNARIRTVHCTDGDISTGN